MSAMPMDAMLGAGAAPAPAAAPKSAASVEAPAIVLSFLEIIGTLLGTRAPDGALLPPNASEQSELEASTKDAEETNVSSEMLLAMQPTIYAPQPKVLTATVPSAPASSARGMLLDGSQRSRSDDTPLSKVSAAPINGKGTVVEQMSAERALAFDMRPEASSVAHTPQSASEAISEGPSPKEAATQEVALQDAGRIAEHIEVIYAESRKASPRSSKKVEAEGPTGYQEFMFAPPSARTFDTGTVVSTAEPVPVVPMHDGPDAPTPVPFSHVTVRLSEEAGGGQVLISLRGGVLRARIVAPDDTATRAIERGIGELRGALVRHGFEETHLTVETRAPTDTVNWALTSVESPTAAKDARLHDAPSRDRRDGEQPREDRSGARQQSQGRSHQRARQERER